VLTSFACLQAMGKGEYFGEDASTSVGYCKGGSKMLVFAVLTDKKEITTVRASPCAINLTISCRSSSSRSR
jgi:hypothetical protein